MAEDFALDLDELRHLQSIAKRPRIISLLSSEINNLEKLSKGTSSASPPQIPAPISTGTKVPSVPALKYSILSSFYDIQGKNYPLPQHVQSFGVDTSFRDRTSVTSPSLSSRCSPAPIILIDASPLLGITDDSSRQFRRAS